MLTIPQIEALRTTNPQLYESLKRLAGASLGPNQGRSLDSQITDGTDYARVVSGALTYGQIDPTKSGELMSGSLPPTWSGSFTYASTTSSLTWSWTGLSIYRADGDTTAIPDGSAAVTGLAAATTYYFYPYWDDTASALDWVAGGAGSPATRNPRKQIPPRSSNLSKDASRSRKARSSRPPPPAAPEAARAAAAEAACARAAWSSRANAAPCRSKPARSANIFAAPPPRRRRVVDAHLRLEVRDAETFIRLHFSNAERST